MYDMKRYIKTLHETVPSTSDIPMPTSPATSRPTSAEVPSWVAKDLSLEIKPMVLVRRAQLVTVRLLTCATCSSESVGTRVTCTHRALTVQQYVWCEESGESCSCKLMLQKSVSHSNCYFSPLHLLSCLCVDSCPSPCWPVGTSRSPLKSPPPG